MSKQKNKVDQLLNKENTKAPVLSMVSFRYDKKKINLVRKWAKRNKVSIQDLLGAMVDDLIKNQGIEKPATTK